MRHAALGNDTEGDARPNDIGSNGPILLTDCGLSCAHERNKGRPSDVRS